MNSLLSCCLLLLVLLSLALPTTSLRTSLLSRQQLSQQFSLLATSQLPNQASSQAPVQALQTPSAPSDYGIVPFTQSPPATSDGVVPSSRPLRRVWEDVLVNSRGQVGVARIEGCYGPTCTTSRERSIQPAQPHA